MSQQLLERLASGAEVPPADVRAWAAGALRRIACGEPVAAALKLDRGQRVRQRDRHLAAAWQLLANDDDSEWKTAAKLAQAIHRHERGMHKRYLLGADDIDPGNELDAVLHSAFCCGAGMMRCQRKLYEHFQTPG